MRLVAAVCLLLCAVVLLPERGRAATLSDPAWQEVTGHAQDIAIDADGTAFVIDADGNVWWWDDEVFKGWRTFPGQLTRISAGGKGMLWGVDTDGEIRRYTGVAWVPAGARGTDVAAGFAGDAAIIMEDGRLALWDDAAHRWTDAVPAGKGVRVALAEDGSAWLVRDDGTVHQFLQDKWRPLPALPAKAIDIDGGPDGTVIVACIDGRLRRWDEARKTWITVPGRYVGTAVAVGPGGMPWALDPRGRIFASTLFTEATKKMQAAAKPTFRFGSYQFQKVRGKARRIAIGADGTVFAVALEDGKLWQWNAGLLGGWSVFPGTLERIAVDPKGNPWGIDPDGRVRRHTGMVWRAMETRALDIAVGGDGTVFILTPEGVAAKWDGKRDWLRLAGAAGVRIAVDPQGQPWLVTAEGTILQHAGKAWQSLPGEAKEIAIGPGGTVMITTPADELKIWRKVAWRWDSVTEKPAAAVLAVGPRGKPWVVSPEGDVYATDMFRTKDKKQKEMTPVAEPAEPDTPAQPPETVTSPDPITWQRVAGTAQDIGIGLKGQVFVVDAAGNLLKWSTRQRRFSSFGAVVKRVAVDGDGNPWGVDAAGIVSRYDGTRWTNLSHKARDIAIGADGSVFVTDRDSGQLFHYSISDNRFRPRVGAGSRVAVDPDGVPWVVDDLNAVRKCGTAGCFPMGATGRDIAVGPDGTVIVAGSLLRLHPGLGAAAGQWERLPGGDDAVAVAVGPKGRPWYVDAANRIFASTFFATDDDRQPAGTITTSTTVTSSTATATVPTITFRKSIPVERKRYGTWVGAGADGKVFAIDEKPSGPSSGYAVYVTTNGGKTFQYYTDVPGDDSDDTVRSLGVTADGRLWTSRYYGRIIEEKSPKGSTREVSGVPGQIGSISPIVAVGSDGTVFALGGDQKAYKYDPSAKNFKKAGISGTFTWIAVDGNGIPWLADDTGRLRRYENGKLVDPGKRIQKAKVFAFGPTGVLFLVDATDDKTIRRWNATNRDFDEVSTGVSTVIWKAIAVDDQGEPWLASNNEIYGPK